MSGTMEGVLYAKEFEALYQNKASMLIDTVCYKAAENSNSIIFPFHDRAASSTAVGRSYSSSSIPANGLNITTKTLTLEMADSKFTESDLHDFFSQTGGASIREALMNASVDLHNLKIEATILNALSAVNVGPSNSAITDARKLLDQAKTILLSQYTPEEDIYCAMTPAFLAGLQQDTQFTSSDYVQIPKFNGIGTTQFVTFNGIKCYIIPSSLPNSGTNDERVFVYNKNAIGFGETKVKKLVYGELEADGQLYARVSSGIGALALQTNGIVELKYDGSAYNATDTIT